MGLCVLSGMGTVLTHLPRTVCTQPVFGRSCRRQADILLLCGKKVIFDRQVCTVSWQQTPSRHASYLSSFAGILSWGFMCTPLHHRSSSSCRVFIRVRFITSNGTSGHGMGVTTLLRPCGEPWCGMETLQAGQPHTPPQPLAVPPSIHLLIPLVLSSRGTLCFPSQYQSSCWQMSSGICGHLKPLHETRRE